MNTAAVKAAGFAGVDAVIDMAHRTGITSMDDRENYGVSIATGGSNLTLLDLTYAYSTIANNGEMRGQPVVKQQPGQRKLEPVALLRVTDGAGRTLLQFDGPAREQVVQAGYAYQVTDILKDNNAKRHTYNAPEVQFGMPDRRPIAAKTGTQQGPSDIKTVLATWNFGYVPDLTVGVWVGNADNKLVNPNLPSASSSLLIWKEVMAAALQMLNIPPREFPVPADITWEQVNGKREPIVKGTKVQLREDLRMWAAAGNPTTATGGLFQDERGSATPGPGGSRPSQTPQAPRPPGASGTATPASLPAATRPPAATAPAGPVVPPQPVATQAPAPQPAGQCQPQPPYYRPCSP